MEQFSILTPEDMTPNFLESYQKLIQENFDDVFNQEMINSYIGMFNLNKLIQIIQNQGLIAIYKSDTEIKGLLLGTGLEGGVGTIIWIIVSKDQQKKGIGKKLFIIAKEHYSKLKCHKLKLTAPSEEVVNFYKKLGMNLEGFHPNHWYNHDFWSLGINLYI